MFIPHTDQETREMLEAVGVKDIKALFKDIPEKYRFPKFNLTSCHDGNGDHG